MEKAAEQNLQYNLFLYKNEYILAWEKLEANMPMTIVDGRLLLVSLLICKPYNELFLHTRTE